MSEIDAYLEKTKHICPECRETPIRKDVLDFAWQMELNLRRNDHKGGYMDDGFTIHDAYLRSIDESRELLQEIFNEDVPNIIHKSADTANFLMMIHARLKAGLR